MVRLAALAACVCLTAAGCGGEDHEPTGPAPRDVRPGAKVAVPDASHIRFEWRR